MFSFTQGILLGQASMIILAALFLKYVVFEDPEAAKRAREERRRLRAVDGADDVAGGGRGDGRGAKGKKGGKGKTAARTPPDFPTATLPAAALLGALSYDLSTHAPESLDWLNVLSAQLIASYRALAASHALGGARALVEEALNRRTGGTEEGAEDAQGMVGLDFIEVDERVELDLDYIDTVVLAVSTRVVLNFPRPRFAVLPVSLSLTLERFSGTLTVELPPPPPAPLHPSPTDSHHHPHAHPSLHLSLHPDFELQLATSSLLGSRAKLQDVPKVEQLLVARIRAAIQDRVVWPGRVEIALPGVSRNGAHHHHHHHSSSSAEGGASVPPLADDLASSPLRTSPLSPLSSATTDPLSPVTPPSFSSPSLAAPPNPLLARNSSSSGTSTPETPSVDLSGPDGPSIALHPRVRPPPAHLPSAGESPALPRGQQPSPSESLPGYFPPAGLAAGGKRLSGSAPGMRYRPTAAAAGAVGIGVGR
ncbi:ERMES complex subunit mmm1 [Rhodotorula kratochvilovae]